MTLHRRDVVCTGMTMMCLALLNIQPLNQSFGLYLGVIASVFGAFSGVAFFAFVAGSQVVSDPMNSTVTLMQAGAVAAILAMPFNGWLRGAPAAGRYWLALTPLVGWVLSILAINGTVPLLGYDLVSGVLVGGIAAGYVAKEGEGRLLLYVGGAVAGMSLASMGFWGNRIGLPVTVLEIEDAVRGFTRIGVGKGDVNTTGLNLPIALWGGIALVIPSGSALERRGSAGLAWILIVGAGVIMAPAIFATGSRTAVYEMIAGAVILIYVATRAQAPRGMRRAIMKVGLVACAAGLVVALSPLGDDVRYYIAAMANANADQAASFGANAVIAGRTTAWNTHLSIISEFPLTGIPAGTPWDFGEYGTAMVGQYGTVGLAHNTVIQFGSLAGVPAMALFVYVVASPIWRLRGCLFAKEVFPVAFVYVLACLGMLGLSIAGWKTFWMLLALVRACRVERAKRR